MTAILSLMSLLLTVGKGLLLRADRQKLKDTGRLEAVYAASQEFQKALAKVRAIDAAVTDDDADPEWASRLRERAGSADK